MEELSPYKELLQLYLNKGVVLVVTSFFRIFSSYQLLLLLLLLLALVPAYVQGPHYNNNQALHMPSQQNHSCPAACMVISFLIPTSCKVYEKHAGTPEPAELQ